MSHNTINTLSNMEKKIIVNNKLDNNNSLVIITTILQIKIINIIKLILLKYLESQILDSEESIENSSLEISHSTFIAKKNFFNNFIQAYSCKIR